MAFSSSFLKTRPKTIIMPWFPVVFGHTWCPYPLGKIKHHYSNEYQRAYKSIELQTCGSDLFHSFFTCALATLAFQDTSRGWSVPLTLHTNEYTNTLGKSAAPARTSIPTWISPLSRRSMLKVSVPDYSRFRMYSVVYGKMSLFYKAYSQRTVKLDSPVHHAAEVGDSLFLDKHRVLPDCISCSACQVWACTPDVNTTLLN